MSSGSSFSDSYSGLSFYYSTLAVEVGIHFEMILLKQEKVGNPDIFSRYRFRT